MLGKVKVGIILTEEGAILAVVGDDCKGKGEPAYLAVHRTLARLGVKDTKSRRPKEHHPLFQRPLSFRDLLPGCY